MICAPRWTYLQDYTGTQVNKSKFGIKRRCW